MKLVQIAREILGFVFYFIAQLRPYNRILSLYFHNPSPRVFENVIKWCVYHKYRFVNLDEMYNTITGKICPNERIVFISFDDGWRTNLDLLPIVEKYSVPITIFVTTEPIISGNYWWEYGLNLYGANEVEKIKKLPYAQFKEVVSEIKTKCNLIRSAINESELEKLIKHPLVSVQSHTVTHPILTNCDMATLTYELSESKKYLEEKLKKEVIAFSYPNGNVGMREMEAVKKAGYKIAFTTQPINIDIGKTNIFLVPRRAMNTYGGKYENIAKILGIWQKFIK